MEQYCYKEDTNETFMLYYQKIYKTPSVWNANVYAFTQLFRDKERWQHMAVEEKNHMNNWHFSNPHIYVT